MKQVTIYTDGSCLRNGLEQPAAGWAAILSCGTHVKELSGSLTGERPTNNAAELTAVIKAISALKQDAEAEVTVISDSEYVTKSITEKRVHAWNRNGWKTASKTPVANKELWLTLIKVCKERPSCKFTFAHVDGHAGDKYNERCDKLARAAASR